MSNWQPRLVLAAVVAVLVLSVLIATRSRRTSEEEPQRDRSHAQAPVDTQVAAKPPRWRADPLLERGSAAGDAGTDRPRPGRADVAPAEPATPPREPDLGAPSGFPAAHGDAAQGAAGEEAGAGGSGAGDRLAQAASASGVVPRFAAFRQDSGVEGAGPKPSEQENVDFSISPGAYFPPNALLGYPGRAGLQVEQGTVMFWVQPVDWDGTDNLAYSFFLLRDINSLDHTFSILKSQRSLRFQIINADGVEFDIFSPISDWLRGEWHHVAATWGDSLMDLYVDGSLVGEQAVDGLPAVQPNSPAYWGSTRGTFGAGAILADGRIFDVVLTPADIAADAQRVPQ